ncbi:MAG: type II toxin-antitoxin system HigB family toxin [bacterium]
MQTHPVNIPSCFPRRCCNLLLKMPNIRHTFGSADLLGQGSSRVVFNIGGNNYRMICKYHFGSSLVHLFVCWIGTHAEYDELCNHGGQYTVNEH